VVCASAGNPCGIRSICVYGGVPKGPQLAALRGGAQVVIATPGRLLDLYQNDGVCDLSTVQYLVLDEVSRDIHSLLRSSLAINNRG
jgi:ATP-dependent RNA helicase DBP3